MSNPLLDGVISITRQAGKVMLEIYNDPDADFGVEAKSDESPLTKADLAAHKVIMAGLAELSPEIPVLSEESDDISTEMRRSWNKYWLVDPLDGTKEFIKKNGEFTVNIALIDNGEPVLGVVYVPVKDVVYAGSKGEGAIKQEAGETKVIKARKLSERDGAVVIVGSRSHGGEALAACVEKIKQQLGETDFASMGSSLKLCLVAEGAADIYPRLALTSEWDTGAAQAVVEAAGGKVVDIDFNILRYNQKDDILNPFFYVVGDSEFDWEGLIGKG